MATIWGALVLMYIHEMTEAECRHALEGASMGRIACVRDNQPYVVPVYFAFDGKNVYGFATVGQKTEWMRLNPLVCFEVDELVSNEEWLSIVVFGRYEELPEIPEFEYARVQAHTLLKKRAMWWEPAYVSQQHRDQPHSLTPIFYRIHIEKMTGHRATPEANTATTTAGHIPNHKRWWLDKLLHPGPSNMS